MALPRSLMRRALLGATLLTPTAAAQSSFALPADYFGRFGSIQPVISNTEGYGVRYFPLPIKPDIRLNLVKAPTYWDYALSTRVNDTTFLIGKVYNVPTLEVTHNPYKGAQFGSVVRGSGGLSTFTGGYAFTAWQDRLRILNNVGVAFKGNLGAPYTQSEVSVGYGQAFGKFNTYVAATGRAYLFPAQREGQYSTDLYAAVNVSPVQGLLLDASHFERFVSGTVAVPDFGLARYEQSTFNVTYRLNAGWPSPMLGLGAVRTRVTRDWTNDLTYVYGDVFLRTDYLGSMVGPSIGYRFGPGKAEGVWLLSLTSIPR